MNIYLSNNQKYINLTDSFETAQHNKGTFYYVTHTNDMKWKDAIISKQKTFINAIQQKA